MKICEKLKSPVAFSCTRKGNNAQSERKTPENLIFPSQIYLFDKFNYPLRAKKLPGWSH